jgi:predicted nucleic-acid-binding protein
MTVAEIVWVLGSVYALPDGQIAETVERLLQADTLILQNEQQVFTAVAALKKGWGGFSDALIAALVACAGCESTWTFDKNALRLAGFELLD